MDHHPRVRDTTKVVEPLQTLIHEQAKSIVAIKELQNQVSSLLEFKNALLETFPHLQSRFPSPTTLQQPTRVTQNHTVTKREQKSGYLLGHSQTYASPTRHVDVVSSDETQPSWTGLDTGQLIANGVPGSTNVGTSMSTSRGFRKSSNASKKNFPDNHLAADSGFSTETSKETASGGSAVVIPAPRWDWSPGSDGTHLPQHDDELMVLLDLIHRKSVRLRNEVEDFAKPDNIPPEGNLQRLQPRMPHNPSTLRVIDENEPPESNHQVTRKLELEVDTLRREREVLISRIGELESENANAHGRLGELEGQVMRLTSSGNPSTDSSKSKKSAVGREDEAGIIHSVHIRTGGGEEGIRRTIRSVSQGDLSVRSSSQGNGASGNSCVSIEIKNGDLLKTRSQEHILQGISKHRNSHPSTLLAPTISVVNLRHPPGLENHLPHHPSNELSSDLRSRSYLRGANQTFGMPQTLKIHHTSKGLLLPGRMAVPSSIDDPTSKSKSVENLLGSGGYPGEPVLGLKAANSEMNVHHPFVSQSKAVRLKGVTSELNVSKLGQSEKVRFDIIEGIASLPAEIKGNKPVQIRPNRDKIRTILTMSNVIELQRQLLTTVMENEVYRSQLERVTESWKEKISSFEKVNSDLKSNLAELKQENDDLKQQMSSRASELETTKTKLNMIGLESKDIPKDGVEGVSLEDKTLSKTENRVTFDLKATQLSAARLKTSHTTNLSATSTNPGMAIGTRRLLPGTHTSQLPSDARQRLEEMANSGIRRQSLLGQQQRMASTSTTNNIQIGKSPITNPAPQSSPSPSPSANNQVSNAAQTPTRTPRRPSLGKGSRANSPVKNVHMDPIQELLSQHQKIVGNKSNSVTSHASNNIYNLVQQLQSRHDSSAMTGSTPTPIRSIPQTPISREKSLNLKNNGGTTNSHNNSSDVVFSGNTRAMIENQVDLDSSSDMIENNNSNKKVLPLIRARQLPVTSNGGIVKVSREAFDDIQEQEEPDDHFDDISLGANDFLSQNTVKSVSALSESHSLPPSIGAKSSFCRSSWEANNHLEETTHASHILQSHFAHCNSISVEEIYEKQDSSIRGSQDSLSKKTACSTIDEDKTVGFEMDSIMYDFRQASPEDSLNNVNQVDLFFDSLGYVASLQGELKTDPVSPAKKLIIPYNDSYSSNTSVYSGSRESLAPSEYDDSRAAEPDSLATCSSAKEKSENLSMENIIKAQKDNFPQLETRVESHQPNRFQTSMYGTSPPALRTDTWLSNGYPRPYQGLDNPVGSVPASRTQSPVCVARQPNAPVSQSLMRMATERMKRKFLGWS